MELLHFHLYNDDLESFNYFKLFFFSLLKVNIWSSLIFLKKLNLLFFWIFFDNYLMTKCFIFLNILREWNSLHYNVLNFFSNFCQKVFVMCLQITADWAYPWIWQEEHTSVAKTFVKDDICFMCYRNANYLFRWQNRNFFSLIHLKINKKLYYLRIYSFNKILMFFYFIFKV